MNEKTNPWMLATVLLAGMIIGFGVGRIVPGAALQGNVTGLMNAANAATNNQNQAPGQEQPANNAPTPTINTTVAAYTVPHKLENGNWALGADNAPVTIQEFSDYQCPFCHMYFENSFGQILTNYIATGKVHYVFYNSPLSFHAQAPKAAEAALCAGEQDKYWEMHDLLFNNQDVWSGQSTAPQTFKDLAKSLGIDMNQFGTCLDNDKYSAQIAKDEKLGETKGVSGTPTFFINGTKVVGAQPYETIQTYIEDALKK